MESLESYGYAFLFFLAGIIFVIGGMLTSQLISPKRPSPEKLTTYECGEDPVGSSWIQFNMRFYVMGIVFLIFDIEMLVLFPWVLVFADKPTIKQFPAWDWLGLAEIFIFLLILCLGLVYIWIKGDVDWVKPQIIAPMEKQIIPKVLYEKINQKYLTKKK
jgi:NADH-quinone oxidoreductase subunit A